ncbi:iron-siderophore ABC transporter substrate-binding protein [Pseudomonas sp. 5P_3.1_Bac2]|uniref:iron-siderophore ABC transporter substrate-binding protein n=1 Tax=Pseudomonas sp. 5P_3.1_Bac2 TaxID=2971617 RepID=UPI0021C68704|nr:iron-siderophore ABC transporter substrate-binding protein [Pseudomonas sp. 5P_3.1_Bac2]MCU1719236.1 iron-siderophore ABC transporter substrate-binding protein [Pseudomonas sp. 5P_3.1_Bac2]
MKRRAVLQGLLLAGGLPWRMALAEPPKRIVSLSWEMTEHLLQLGVLPQAVADAQVYRDWVVHPTLPLSVPNLGTRTEPNLELMAQLQPELILITPLLEDIRPKLERIATVLSYQDFTQEQDNQQLQRRNLLSLAAEVGAQNKALSELARMDQHLEQLRQQLYTHFNGQPPKVAVVRFDSPTVFYAMGPNSMPQHALSRLGLSPALEVAVSRWGALQKPVTDLGQIDDGVVLYIEPFAQHERLFSTALWQGMGFVKRGHVAAMRSVWTHGGIFCIEQLAEAISAALLTLPADAGAQA